MNDAARQDDQTRLVLPAPAAKNYLSERLQSGALVAEGIAPGQTAHAPIRDAEWATVTYHPENQIPVDAIAGWGEKRPRFTDVFVRSAAVRALWPEKTNDR